LCNWVPFRIVWRDNDVNYVMQRSPTAKPGIAHIDRLTWYYGTAVAAWKQADESVQLPVSLDSADALGAQPAGHAAIQTGDTSNSQCLTPSH